MSGVHREQDRDKGRTQKIIMEDTDGGYFLAEYKTTVENADEEFIHVYKQKEYYHTLESAIRDA